MELCSSSLSSEEHNSLSSESFNVAYIGTRWVATGNGVVLVGVVCFKYVARMCEARRQTESLMCIMTVITLVVVEHVT